jgi:nucleoside-diphosphate-sugar epimerase
MKVVIVGGNSSLGLALGAVASASCEVITAGRTNCDLTFDLTWPFERMVLPNDVDVIVHTAAHFGGKSAADILEAEHVNVLGTLKLCQAAVSARARHLVLISSIFASLKEDSEHHSIYALSKRHAEEVARFVCATHSLPLTVLRPSQIYGAGPRFRVHQPFLHAMMDKAKKGEDIVLYGTRDPRRNFIYIDDLTAVISRVIDARIVGTYFCQHPSNVTYSQIAKAAFEAFDTRGSVRFLRDKPDIPDNVFAADDSLYEAIGFRPSTTIEDGLRRIARLSS